MVCCRLVKIQSALEYSNNFVLPKIFSEKAFLEAEITINFFENHIYLKNWWGELARNDLPLFNKSVRTNKIVFCTLKHTK